MSGLNFHDIFPIRKMSPSNDPEYGSRFAANDAHTDDSTQEDEIMNELERLEVSNRLQTLTKPQINFPSFFGNIEQAALAIIPWFKKTFSPPKSGKRDQASQAEYCSNAFSNASHSDGRQEDNSFQPTYHEAEEPLRSSHTLYPQPVALSNQLALGELSELYTGEPNVHPNLQVGPNQDTEIGMMGSAVSPSTRYQKYGSSDYSLLSYEVNNQGFTRYPRPTPLEQQGLHAYNTSMIFPPSGYQDFEMLVLENEHLSNVNSDYSQLKTSQIHNNNNNNNSQNIKGSMHDLPRPVSKATHIFNMIQPTTCPICSKKIVPRTLNSHVEAVHVVSGQKPFCDICQKSYASSKPIQFQKYMCYKWMIQAKNLISHYRDLHRTTPVHPHICQYQECGKEFKRESDLQRHVARTHTGIKPHKCSYCDATFMGLTGLTYHLENGHLELMMKQ